MSLETIWKSSLNTIAEHISDTHFSTWFRPIRVFGGGDEFLELEVPNGFFLEWIKEHYLPLIHDAVRRASKKDLSLKWRVSEDAQRRTPPAPAAAAKKTAGAAGPSVREASQAKPQKSAEGGKTPYSFNPKYTFDNFVVGKANEFAHAACFAVSNHLGKKYNPLFIYGCSGLGKTHLVQAIGQKVLGDNSGAKVAYYTSEEFMNDFINYVKRQKMSEFRNKFRNLDVLLIDDIHFWAGKVGTQEEFFHTFNTLYESHKQIVVTSDKFPKDIDGLEERLRSRFEWGLIADIQTPDVETKMAILRKKAQLEGLKISDDVIEWLASVSGSNIRDLEGFLNRIVAESVFTNKEITLTMSKEALKNLLKKEDKHLSIEDIQKSVATHFNIKLSDMRSKRRHKTITLPRQFAMYISREYGKFSFPEIGSSFGGKDHSTAIHAVKKIEKDLKDKTEIRHALRNIKQKLGLI